MLKNLQAHVRVQQQCNEWIGQVIDVARRIDLNQCHAVGVDFAVESSTGDVYLYGVKSDSDHPLAFSATKFGDLLLIDESIKNFIFQAIIRKRDIYKLSIIYSEKLNGSISFQLEKNKTQLFWDDIFPRDEIPELDIVEKSAKIYGNNLSVRYKMAGYGLVQTHHQDIPLYLLSERLLNSIIEKSIHPFNVPNSHSIYEAGEKIYTRSIEDWDIGETTREDPYMGSVQKFYCRQCSMGSFGFSGERICMDCGGGMGSAVGSKKHEILKECAELANVELNASNWRELDTKFGELLVSWRAAGNAGETDDALWSQLQVSKNKFMQSKNNFFEQRKKTSAVAETAKRGVIARANEILQHFDKNGSIDLMRSLMTEWKSITGHCGKVLDEELWGQFQNIQLNFYAKANEKREQFHKAKLESQEKKEKIAARAEFLSNSTDWASTTEQFHALLDDWKAAGHVPKEIDSKLWEQFNSARQKFFHAKNKNFGISDSDIKERLSKKESLISTAVLAREVIDIKFSLNLMHELMSSWKSIGTTGQNEEQLWAKFQAAREEVFCGIKNVQLKNKILKENIIQKSTQAAKSTNWRQASDEMRSLMDEWRRTGSSGREVDDELWTEFQRQRQMFFEAQSKAFEKINSLSSIVFEDKRNLKVKNPYLTDSFINLNFN